MVNFQEEKELLKLGLGSFLLIFFILSKISIYKKDINLIFRLIGHILTLQNLFQKVTTKIMTKDGKIAIECLYNQISSLSFLFLSNLNEENLEERHLNFAFLGYQMFLLSLLNN